MTIHRNLFVRAHSRHVASTNPSEHTRLNCETLLPPDQRPDALFQHHVYSATAYVENMGFDPITFCLQSRCSTE